MSQINWIELGRELDYRSKKLISSGHSISSETDREIKFEEIRLFHDLKRSLFDEKEVQRRWDWVFEPLIYELFNQDVALWTCLGFFQKKHSSFLRRWRYLFHKDLSHVGPSDEEFEDFCRALQAFTFNACYSEIADGAILPTSSFLENLSGENFTDSQYPYGATLFASLQSDSRLLDELRTTREKKDYYLGGHPFLADWSDLFELAHRKERERADKLRKMLSKDDIKKFLKGEKDKLGEVPLSLPQEDEKSASKEYARAIENTFLDFDKGNSLAKLTEERGYLRSLITLNAEGDQEQIHTAGALLEKMSPGENEELLETFFEKHPEESVKLTQYVAWIHDVACGQTDAIFTVPAWFPGAKSGGRSGALILGLKENSQLTPEDVAGLTTAFRMGSTGVAREDQRVKGREAGIGEVMEDFSHEISSLNQAISFSRMPSLHEVFQINDMDRPQEDELDDWYEPAGFIETDHEHTLKEWRVCPTPKVLKGLSNILAIWGGSRGWRAGMGLSSQMTLVEALDTLTDVARRTTVAERFINSKGSPDKVSRAINHEREFEEEVSSLPSVDVQADSRARKIEWLGSTDDSVSPQSEFIRLFVASMSNVFKHAKSYIPVRIDLKGEQKGFKMSVINYIEDKNNTKGETDIGTERVIELSCNRLNGELKKFGRMDSGNFWVTSIELPFSADNKWLSVSN